MNLQGQQDGAAALDNNLWKRRQVMLRHVVDTVHRYRELSEQLDIQGLPLVDNDLLLEDFSGFRSRDARLFSPQFARQQALRGAGMVVLADRDVQDGVDDRWRGLLADGPGGVLVIAGSGFCPPYEESFYRRFGDVNLLAPPTRLNEAEALIRRLTESSYRALIAPAATLDYLAGVAMECGVEGSFDGTIHALGGPLARWQVDRARRALGPRVIEHMEWFEGLLSLTRRGGDFLAATDNDAEILDERGSAVSCGELVLTSLSNRSMPLVRYRTGLSAEWVGDDGAVRILQGPTRQPVPEAVTEIMRRHVDGDGLPSNLWGLVRQARLFAERDGVCLRVSRTRAFRRPQHEEALRRCLDAAGVARQSARVEYRDFLPICGSSSRSA